jgi:RHS repeat-associated protein
MSSSAGSVTHEYRYDSYGRIEAGSTQAGYSFTSREWDPETGLFYYRARYLDAETGRFISEDPIGLTGGINVYTYANSNPVFYIDPSGELGEILLVDIGANIVMGVITGAVAGAISTAIHNAIQPNNPQSYGQNIKWGAIAGGIGGGVASFSPTLGAAISSGIANAGTCETDPFYRDSSWQVNTLTGTVFGGILGNLPGLDFVPGYNGIITGLSLLVGSVAGPVVSDWGAAGGWW